MYVPRGGRVTLPQAYAYGAAAARQVVLLDATRNYVEWRRNALGNAISDNAIGTRHGNATAAAAGAQQRSPMAVLQGNAWSTGAAASRAVEFAKQVVPAQGASDAAIQTGSSLLFAVQVNGAGWSPIAELAGDGQLRAGDGTAALPGQSFRTTPDMGGRRVSATQFGFSTAGATRYLLDSSQFDVQVPLGVRLNGASFVAGIPLQVVNGADEGGCLQRSTSATGYGRNVLQNDGSDSYSSNLYSSGVGGAIFGKNNARLALLQATATAMAMGTGNATDVVLGTNQTAALLVNGSTQAVTLVSKQLQRARGASIASTTTLTLGADGDAYPISGTNTIDGIVTTGMQAGTEKRLEFTGNAVVTHNSGAPGANAVAILLVGSLDFAAENGAVLGIQYNGTNWVEMYRRLP